MIISLSEHTRSKVIELLQKIVVILATCFGNDFRFDWSTELSKIIIILLRA